MIVPLIYILHRRTFKYLNLLVDTPAVLGLTFALIRHVVFCQDEDLLKFIIDSTR